MFKRRGSNYERELQRKLWDNGFVCIRVAGSGSSTYPAPDLIVIKDGKVIVIEVKSTKLDRIYLDDIQLKQLEIIRQAGAYVFIATKFIGNGWFFFEFDSVMENRKIDFSRAQEEGKSFHEFIEILRKI